MPVRQPAVLSAVQHCLMDRDGCPPPGQKSDMPADPVDAQWLLREKEQAEVNRHRMTVWQNRKRHRPAQPRPMIGA